MKTYWRVFFPIMLLLVMVAGMWGSTQWVAHSLRYPVEFGEPLFVIAGFPVFAPWLFFVWWYQFGAVAPQGAFDHGIVFMGGSFMVAGGLIVATAVSRAKPKSAPTSHGTASWATDKEIKDSGLLDAEGVILGLTDEGKFLRHNGPEHVLLTAPTRGGKGVNTIIPTLLSWPHSVVVTDIKKENWQITAGYRKEKLHNRVLKFEPSSEDGTSVRFNPLDEIRIRTVSEVKDTQNIVLMLVDPGGGEKLDNDHWKKTASAFLLGVILHLKYTKKNPSLPDINTFLTNPNKDFDETLHEMLETEHLEDKETISRIYDIDFDAVDENGEKVNPLIIHPRVAGAAMDMLNKAEKERSSVLSTAVSCLGLYTDPTIGKNIACSEFCIDDLMNFEQPVSLYLVTPPGEIDRLRPLFRMVVTLIMDKLTTKMDFKDGKPIKGYKHRLLLLMDEFPKLGKLEKVESGLAYIAGYGLKALLVIQDLNQLYSTYTKNNSIVGNCHVRVFFTPNELETQKYVSDSLGKRTELVENKNTSGHWLNASLGNISVSTNETGRALMNPDEVGKLSQKRLIVFMAGRSPILGRKLFYYDWDAFTDRLQACPLRSDVVREVPVVPFAPPASVLTARVPVDGIPPNTETNDVDPDDSLELLGLIDQLDKDNEEEDESA